MIFTLCFSFNGSLVFGICDMLIEVYIQTSNIYILYLYLLPLSYFVQDIEYLESASLMVELHGRQASTHEARRDSLLNAYTLADRRRASTFTTPIDENRLSSVPSADSSSAYPSTANSTRISANSVILETDETGTESNDTDLDLDTDDDRGNTKIKTCVPIYLKKIW